MKELKRSRTNNCIIILYKLINTYSMSIILIVFYSFLSRALLPLRVQICLFELPIKKYRIFYFNNTVSLYFTYKFNYVIY